MRGTQLLSLGINLLCCGAMGFLLVVLLARYFVRPFREDALGALCPGGARPRAGRRLETGRMLAFVAAAFVVSRLLVYVVGLAWAFAVGQSGTYLEDPLSLWVRWDARHYVGLAENWYVNEGDARYHLVFFPLYPLAVRALSLAFSLDAAAAGTLLSNACLLVCAWAMYRLVELGQGQEAGRRAVTFLLFAPMSFFFSIPYSESLFLMLCLLCVLCARKRRMALAVLLGALAANARILGVLCAVPIYYEYLLMVKEKKGGWPMALGCVLRTMPVLLGLGAYLLLNYQVSGDPFRFLAYQKEHWYQQMGSLWNTLSYTLSGALSYPDQALRLGTWIPQTLYILCCIGLLLWLFRRIDPAEGAYALLYIYIAVSPTWLLSGSRYLTAMYALYPMLAMAARRKAWEYALLSLSVAGSCYFIYMYLFTGGLM